MAARPWRPPSRRRLPPPRLSRRISLPKNVQHRQFDAHLRPVGSRRRTDFRKHFRRFRAIVPRWRAIARKKRSIVRTGNSHSPPFPPTFPGWTMIASGIVCTRHRRKRPERMLSWTANQAAVGPHETAACVLRRVIMGRARCHPFRSLSDPAPMARFSRFEARSQALTRLSRSQIYCEVFHGRLFRSRCRPFIPPSPNRPAHGNRPALRHQRLPSPVWPRRPRPRKWFQHSAIGLCGCKGIRTSGEVL